MKKLYFWANIVTPHWLYTLANLGIELGVAVEVYADKMFQLEGRKQFGWDDLQCFEGICFHDKKKVKITQVLGWEAGYHLITNPFNDSFNKQLIAALEKADIRFGLQQSMPGLMSNAFGRQLRSVAYGFLFRRHINCADYVLCHGEMCRHYLQQRGCVESKLHPSGYFVPRYRNLVARSDAKTLRAVYLGQFIERKAVLSLAYCLLKRLKTNSISFDFAGAGYQRRNLEELWAGPHGKVLPPIKYEEVIPFLRQYDMLILPSRADEWAVVVNEAIHAGCAVIVTDKCGAADLVRYGKCGVVVDGVEACVDALIAAGDNLEQVRQWQAAAERLSPLITPDAGARYLASIIRDKAPSIGGGAAIVPWKSFN